MLRDIDYAATAVRTALLEKFGRKHVIDDLQVTANESTISVQQGQHLVEGTRDSLLTALHKAASYDQFWRICSEIHQESKR